MFLEIIDMPLSHFPKAYIVHLQPFEALPNQILSYNNMKLDLKKVQR